MRFSAVAASPRALAALIWQVDAGRLSLRQRQLNSLLDWYVIASDAQHETQLHNLTRMAEAAQPRKSGKSGGKNV